MPDGIEYSRGDRDNGVSRNPQLAVVASTVGAISCFPASPVVPSTDERSALALYVRWCDPIRRRGGVNRAVVAIDGRDGGRDAMAVALTLVSNLARLVVVADTGAALWRVARQERADLIVVGGSYRGGSDGPRADDDPLSAMHEPSCPVAVAPHGYADGSGRLERIGVAYDGTPEGDVALSHARRLAEGRAVRVIVRHAGTLPANGSRNWAGQREALDRTLRQRIFASLGKRVTPEISIAVGPSRLGLVAFSDGVDLLICGAGHLGFLADGQVNVTDYLASRCTSPVMIVPAEPRSGAPATAQVAVAG
jgi:nucleotide-binding universal stress UspA family protein